MPRHATDMISTSIASSIRKMTDSKDEGKILLASLGPACKALYDIEKKACHEEVYVDASVRRAALHEAIVACNGDGRPAVVAIALAASEELMSADVSKLYMLRYSSCHVHVCADALT